MDSSRTPPNKRNSAARRPDAGTLIFLLNSNLDEIYLFLVWVASFFQQNKIELKTKELRFSVQDVIHSFALGVK